MATFATRSPSKQSNRKQAGSPAAGPGAPAEVQIPQDEIARRAFEKFAARGFTHGSHLQDWLDAEDELRSEYRDRQ